MKTKYEAETRPNGRGGFEVAMPGTPIGTGFGNHPTEADAYYVAKHNYEPSRIKRYTEPKAEKQPAIDRPAKPFAKGKIEAAFKKITKRRAHT